MRRRAFLQTVSAGALAAASSPAASPTPLPRRPLGRTGEQVSIIGFPGLALIHGDQATCTAAIRRAFERGVNYFDVAPAYGDGDAETKMGIGLQSLDRSRYFLACKTKMRDRKGAQEELDRSLKRLKTDHFDLYQMHALQKPDEVRRAFGPGGAMETFFRAKDQGKVRFLGFSAHTTKAALEALTHYPFDTVMFPINYIEHFTFGFGKEVLERARQLGAAVLAIKPMCGGKWPEGVERTRRWWYRPIEDPEEIALALRFTLSQEPVAAGIPPAWLDLLDKAIAAAATHRPITEPELARLRRLARTRLSVFQERQDVAWRPALDRFVADNPHEGHRPCSWT